MTEKKISSVLELSRYKMGDMIWWVALRYSVPVRLDEEDEWMLDTHPRVLFDGPYKPTWQSRSRLPKLHHSDFNIIVPLLTSDLIVEPFEIDQIIRSEDTGEFYYANEDEEWMPESCLCDTKEAARKERDRILKLLVKWLKKTQG